MEQNSKGKTGKRKQKALLVDKQTILYQPWKLIKSGYDATAFQQNVIISVLSKLKNSLYNMREEYVSGARQLSLFDHADSALYMDEDDAMTFSIHMKELGVEPQNYQRAFNAVCNISDIDVWIPVQNSEDGKEELERAKLFSIIVNKDDVIVDENNQVIGYKYEKHNPQVKLKLRRNVAETLFQGQIHTFLEQTAMNIAEKFPKRLYMYFANYKNMGEVTIDYWKFRQQIGFEDRDPEKIQYPKFFDFRKRVLDPSVKKLKEMAELGQAEYWFEYEALYKGAGRAKAPDLLKFTIHLSQLGEDFEKQKDVFKERKRIEDRLATTFEQTTAQVRKLVSALGAEDYGHFNAKLDELQQYLMTNRNQIRDRRSYANRVLTDYLQDSEELKKVKEQMERQKENSKSQSDEANSSQSVSPNNSGDNNGAAEHEDTVITDPHGLITAEERTIINDYVNSLKLDPSRAKIVDAISITKLESGFVLYLPSMSTYKVFQNIIDAITSELSDLLDLEDEMTIRLNN